MIKNAIIIILMLLLLITIYSYYCLSNKMNNFERKRLEHIINKENELSNRESTITKITDCNEKYLKYKNALEQVNNLLVNLNINDSIKNLNDNNLSSEVSNEAINSKLDFSKKFEDVKKLVENKTETEYIKNINIA